MHNFSDLIVGGQPLETKFNTLIGSLPVKSNLNKQTIVDSIQLRMQLCYYAMYTATSRYPYALFLENSQNSKVNR